MSPGLYSFPDWINAGHMAPENAKRMFIVLTEVKKEVIHVDTLAISHHKNTKAVISDVLLKFFCAFFLKMTWTNMRDRSLESLVWQGLYIAVRLL